jgi:glutamine synthetase
VQSFGAKVFTEGLMFDCSSIRGFQQIHESGMLPLLDPATAVLDPFHALCRSAGSKHGLDHA